MCASGKVNEEILPVFWGKGRNGKSTLINAAVATLGTDYASKLRSEFLMPTKYERHPTEVADLFGRRLTFVEELPQGARLNEALIKDLTSRGLMKGRRMREDFFDFEKTHKMILLTNHRPKIVGDDDGIWRRLRLVPFDVAFWDPDKHTNPEADGLDPALRQDKEPMSNLSPKRRHPPVDGTGLPRLAP